MKTFKTLLLVCFTMFLCLGGGQAAQADFGGSDTVVIMNSTNASLTFEMRWEDGPWQTFRVGPGERQSFEASPTAHAIRYDAIGGDNQVTYRAYKLDANVGYAFQFAADGRTLHLVQEEFFTN